MRVVLIVVAVALLVGCKKQAVPAPQQVAGDQVQLESSEQRAEREKRDVEYQKRYYPCWFGVKYYWNPLGFYLPFYGRDGKPLECDE